MTIWLQATTIQPNLCTTTRDVFDVFKEFIGMGHMYISRLVPSYIEYHWPGILVTAAGVMIARWLAQASQQFLSFNLLLQQLGTRRPTWAQLSKQSPIVSTLRPPRFSHSQRIAVCCVLLPAVYFCSISPLKIKESLCVTINIYDYLNFVLLHCCMHETHDGFMPAVWGAAME